MRYLDGHRRLADTRGAREHPHRGARAHLPSRQVRDRGVSNLPTADDLLRQRWQLTRNRHRADRRGASPHPGERREFGTNGLIQVERPGQLRHGRDPGRCDRAQLQRGDGAAAHSGPLGKLLSGQCGRFAEHAQTTAKTRLGGFHIPIVGVRRAVWGSDVHARIAEYSRSKRSERSAKWARARSSGSNVLPR